LKGSWRFEAFRLDLDHAELWSGNHPVPLSPKEFETLYVLVENAGLLVSKEELISRVWPDSFVGDGSLARNISALRRSLGDDVIQTVSRRGYRFVPPVTHEVCSPKAIDPVRAETVQVQPEIAQNTPAVVSVPLWRRWPRLLSAVALVLTAVGVFLLWTQNKSGAAARRPVRIAVLPFVNLTGDPNEEYLCDGLTEAMISELSRLSPDRLSVIARTSAMHYKGTTAPIPQIGRDLNVDYLLESSVRGSTERAHITTQLVRASDATHQWTGEYERDLKDLVSVQQRVAIGIAEEIRLSLNASTNARLRQPSPVDPEAYRYYLLGQFYWNKRDREGLLTARDYFQRAIDRDSQFAKAYAGLANTYLVLAAGYLPDVPIREIYAQGRAASQHALDLDETLPDAHAALAFVQMMDEWNWSGAEANYRRTLTLDPNDANAHHWYALYLVGMKRPQEAVKEIRCALDLDPLSLAISYNAGFIYALAGMHEEAVRQLNRALEIDPNNAVAHGLLGLVYQRNGQYDLSMAEFQTAQKLSGGPVPYLGGVASVEALSGHRQDAEKHLAVLLKAREKQVVPGCLLAFIYAGLGETKSALRWVAAGVEDRSCSAIEINNDTMFDVIRADPRFLDIQREMKLQP